MLTEESVSIPPIFTAITALTSKWAESPFIGSPSVRNDIALYDERESPGLGISFLDEIEEYVNSRLR